MAETLSYAEWLDRLSTERKSGIAFNIFVRSRESGGKLDLDQAWFEKYLKFCEKRGFEATSTVEDVPGANDAQADDEVE